MPLFARNGRLAAPCRKPAENLGEVRCVVLETLNRLKFQLVQGMARHRDDDQGTAAACVETCYK
jgi:hypothetical protein